MQENKVQDTNAFDILTEVAGLDKFNKEALAKIIDKIIVYGPDCIDGVDIDIHMVEVSKFSLLIKLIENETLASVKECV